MRNLALDLSETFDQRNSKKLLVIERPMFAKVRQPRDMAHSPDVAISLRYQRLSPKSVRTESVVFLFSCVLEPDHERKRDHQGGHEHDHVELVR